MSGYKKGKFIRDKGTNNKFEKIVDIVDDESEDGMFLVVNKMKEENFGCYEKEAELWIPQKGEYCWFWNGNQLDYDGRPEFGRYGTLSYTEEFYENIEPYIGEFPVNREDKINTREMIVMNEDCRRDVADKLSSTYKPYATRVSEFLRMSQVTTEQHMRLFADTIIELENINESLNKELIEYKTRYGNRR